MGDEITWIDCSFSPLPFLITAGNLYKSSAFHVIPLSHDSQGLTRPIFSILFKLMFLVLRTLCGIFNDK